MLSKKVLLITYHFPPSAASGAFRLLGFAQHLPTFGWQPLVVAPPTLPWEPIDPRLMANISESAIVRHVPYPVGAPRLLRVLAQYAVWLPRAWSACKRMAEEYQPDAILTSGPPHCVHVLGDWLKRRTGRPWIADFRDPWLSDGSNRPLSWLQRWERRWERRVFANADLVLANAPNARRLYQTVFPGANVMTLTNGFDPRPRDAGAELREDPCVRLLHAGEIYAGRNPAPLFEALGALNRERRAYRLQLLGRCEGNDVPALMREHGWHEFVVLEGQRDYHDTLTMMQAADILVLFDSPGRTIGVPAKLYEYLGAGRPILALAETNGDTANILRSSGMLHRIVPPNDTDGIRRAVCELAEAIHNRENVVEPARLEQFTRENLTGVLSRNLDALIGRPSDAVGYFTPEPLQEVER
jgi:glycosyltransferase involved in cell wall biosynthesis